MARKLKNVKVNSLVGIVNDFNSRGQEEEKEQRRGWNTLLETMLHLSNNYNGFGYLREGEVPEGCPPGMVIHEDGTCIFPDETRRKYYINSDFKYHTNKATPEARIPCLESWYHTEVGAYDISGKKVKRIA